MEEINSLWKKRGRLRQHLLQELRKEKSEITAPPDNSYLLSQAQRLLGEPPLT